ncbi:MAG: hypothetical protein VX498_14635 [Myxococcota bacterium]|nr:hypothetical protein [Myxococcota bacterium]
MYRRYDFTTPEVLEAREFFIPVAVEHTSWQGSLPDRELYFPGFLERSGLSLYDPGEGHGANLLVGLFGLRPDGTLMKTGRTNTERPSREKPETLDYLYEVAALWDEVPAEERSFPGLDRNFPRPEEHWSGAVQVPPMPRDCWLPDCRVSPSNGLVLQSFTRDLPRQAEALMDGGVPRRKDWFKEMYNTDFILIGAPEELVPYEPVEGTIHEWPDWLRERLVRFHLVDNVGGLTMAFPAEAIEKAEVFSKVTRVTPQVVELEFVGLTRAVAENTKGLSQTQKGEVVEVGFETELRGEARWLKEQQRFEEFRFTAIGTRWGGTPQNRRAEVEFPPHTNDIEGGPIGVTFRLFTGPKEDIVPPFFAWNRRGDPDDYWNRSPALNRE